MRLRRPLSRYAFGFRLPPLQHPDVRRRICGIMHFNIDRVRTTPWILLLLALTLCGPAGAEDLLAEVSRNHVNIALSKWGYASATASSVFNSDTPAQRVLDGLWGERERDKWSSAYVPGPHWLVV